MQIVQIENILARRKDPLLIQDGKRYKRITIKINHNGISLRDEEIGKRIGTKKQFTVRSGQFLLSKIDALHGAFGIVPQELDAAIITGNFWTFDVNTELLITEWLLIFTSSEEFIDICRRSSSGTTNRKYLDEKKFLLQKIRLPDKKTQHEIVERYKSAKVLHDRLNEEHGKQRSLIARLKQSLLMDAVRGQLISQDSNEGTAYDLLKKIHDEKEVLVRKGEMKDQKKLRIAEIVNIPFEIPNNWSWIKLDTVIKDLRYGTSKKCDYKTKGIPIMRIPNVSKGKIDLSDIKFAKLEEKERENLKLADGDMLFIRSNGSSEIVGLPVVIDQSAVGYCYAGYLVRVRYLKGIDPNYFCLALKSRYVRQLIELPIRTTTGVKNINSREILNLIVPLPPSLEQKRIVSRFNQLMDYYESLIAESNRQANYSARLSVLLLRSLFQGTAV